MLRQAPATAIIVLIAFAASLWADALPTRLNIRYTGTDFEGLQAFQLEWDALSNATYRVQISTNVATADAWETVDLVTPTSNLGSYKVPPSLRGLVNDKKLFARLVLPQPEITAVEPAVFAPGVGVDAYVLGQCFETNDVLRVDGAVLVGASFLANNTLLCPIPPQAPGTHHVELVRGGVLRSSFDVVCADVAANPELVLQGLPELPPAAPVAMKAKEKANRTKCSSDLRMLGELARSPDGLVFNVVNPRAARAGDDDCDDGDPEIMPFSGEVRQRVVDLAIPGRSLDFVWARTYRSRQTQGSSFGERWTHSYDVRLQPLGGDIVIHDGTGRADKFVLQPDGTYSCPGFFREGTLTGGVFRLTFADTGYWEFNPLDASASAGRLAKIVDRNGNAVSLSYEPSGRLAEIVDDLDRTNTLSYNSSGQLAGLTDFSGRAVTYAYYQLGETGGSPGDLKSVTSPPVTGTPNGNDFPDGKTTTYSYSSGSTTESENHLLVSIADPLGQTTAICDYEMNPASPAYLRCIGLQRWTNTPALITYLPQTPSPANQFAVMRCVMNDPAGNVIECFYDARNRCAKLQEFTGRATPGLPVTDVANRPKGKLRASDPDFYETQWSWNNDSLCTLARSPGGQQVECAYQSDFDKATRARKRADLRVLRELPAGGGTDSDGDGTLDLTEMVWRYDYDPRFGSSEDRSLLGLKEYNPSRDYLAGDTAIFNGSVWQKVDNSESPVNNMRTRINELESRLKALGLLASARGGNVGINETLPYATLHKGWDGTIKGKRFGIGDTSPESPLGRIRPRGWDGTIKGNARGPRQSTSLDGSFSHGVSRGDRWVAESEGGAFMRKGWDGTIRGRMGRPAVNTALNHQAAFVTSSTDPRGNAATASYDASGNLAAVTPRAARDNHLQGGVDVLTALRFAYNAYGQVTAITNAADANGRRSVTTVGWSLGHLNDLVVDAGVGGLGLHTTFEHDARGNLTRCVDARGNDWLFTYNSLDQCVRAQTPTNLTARCTTDFFYDAANNVQAAIVEVRDDTDTKLGSKVDRVACDPLHRVTQLECAVDADHWMTNRFVWDGNDTCKTVLGGDAVSGVDPYHTASFEYDERGLLFREIGAPGSSIATTNEYGYDPNGSPQEISIGIGVTAVKGTFTVPHDRFGRPAGMVDPMGNETLCFYDANDNLKVIRHFGQTNDVAGTNGNLRLAESRFEYDALDRCVRSHELFFDVITQLPLGGGELTSTMEFAPNGDLTAVNVPDALHRTTYAYDTAGRLASVTDALTNRIELACDELGNVLTMTSRERSALGPEQVFSRANAYDSLSRCVSTADNVGNTNRYAYDSLGRCVVQFNPREYPMRFSYDLLDRCTLAVGDLDGDGLLDLAHDTFSQSIWSSSNGRLLATTDSHTNATSYAYDSLGRCTTVTQADGTHCSLVWSPRSNLISEQDANGTVVVHTYDLNDRCVSNSIAPGSAVAATTTFEQFEYDGLSRLVSGSNDGSVSTFAYDSLGNCVRGVSGGLGAVCTFDALGNRLSLAYPGGRAISYTYDALNRCISINESGAALASYDYDGPYRVARVSYANGMRSRIFYDGIAGTPNAPGDSGLANPWWIRHVKAGGSPVVNDCFLTYDPKQNKTARMVTMPSVGPRTNTMTFAYDAADRLVQAFVASNSVLVRATTYNLDRVGNRTNVTGAGCSGDYALDATAPAPLDFPMNQYTATPCDTRGYDENGNLSGRAFSADSMVSYTYDYANRLVEVQAVDSSTGVPVITTVASYAYDALGRRISKTVFPGGLPPTTTLLLYDGDNVIEERESGAVMATYLVDDRYLLGLRRGGQDYYYHCDDQGNVLALTGAGGDVIERYDYDDYGAVTFVTSDGIPTSATSSTVGNVYLFGGMRFDAETGLHNDDGGGYLEAQSGRYLLRAGVPLRFDSSASSFAGGNPWSREVSPGRIIAVGTSRDRVAGWGGGGGGGGGGGFSAKVPRNVLKEYFEKGDKPTQAQFSALIDSTVNLVDDRYLLGLRTAGAGQVTEILARKILDRGEAGGNVGLVSKEKPKPKPIVKVHEFTGHVTLMK